MIQYFTYFSLSLSLSLFPSFLFLDSGAVKKWACPSSDGADKKEKRKNVGGVNSWKTGEALVLIHSIQLVPHRQVNKLFQLLPLPPLLFIMNRFIVSMIALLAVFCAVSTATPLLYRTPQMYDDVQFVKRSNAELINGLIGMDLGKLSAVGKRSNAELINGLLSMNLNKLSGAGRR
uniref:Neuropeptide-Like Protein n=4 Tax=Caenorhabditis TaxID=6237 RepID=A0A1I7U3C8_9PELO